MGIPSTVQAGDVLIATFSWQPGQTLTGAPSGWTLIDTTTYGNVATATFAKVAVSGDAGTNVTCPLTANATYSAALAAWSGATGWGAHAISAGATGTSITAPSVTATANDMVVVAVGARGSVSGDQPVFTFTTIDDQICGSSTSKNMGSMVGHFTPTGGATGDRTITSSVSVDGVGYQIVLTGSTTPPPPTGAGVYVWDGTALVAASAYVWDGTALISATASIA